MLPKRKRFVPPLKFDDDSQDTLEQCSQFTQTQASSVDISFFSCPLARQTTNKADDRIAAFHNSQASSFSDEGMHDSLEINNTLEKDNGNTALIDISPSDQVYHDPITQWHHMASSDCHEEEQSQYHKRPRTASAYKFTVGQKTIIKRSARTITTNRKPPNGLSHTSSSSNSRGYQPSLSSGSTSVGVFDFPVSQDSLKGDTPTHKRDKSCDRSCDYTTHSRRPSDTTLVANRNRKEQMLIDAEVLSIISQARKDIEMIRKQHSDNVQNEKLMADLNSLLRKEKLVKPLSFFISGHEE